MTTELITCEKCDAPGAEEVGLAFLCRDCAAALGLCPRCLIDDGEVLLGDERVCLDCADAERDAEADRKYQGTADERD
jgi:hypothetical protein